MAKSIRSKWRRKCRAIKRERYGAKELERLKKTLGINESGEKDVEMADIAEIATVIDAKTIKNSANATEDAEAECPDKMDIDNDGRVYNKKTMRDQFGNYPVWMNRRKIAKYKKGRAKSQKASTRSHKRLTRKQKKAGKQN